MWKSSNFITTLKSTVLLALRTAEVLSESAATVNQPAKKSRDVIAHAHGATHHNVPIHSVRLMGLLAHQEVIFGSKGETLTIRHDTIDRSCFMGGVLLACQKAMQLDHLVYGLEEVL